MLLQASHRLLLRGRSFRLRIIGDGPEQATLLKMTEDLGLSEMTTFAGFLPIESVRSELASVAAVVVPSICEDVAPVTILEQMMQGNLVIASEIGGLAELVNGDGLKFPAGNIDALASCMRRVLDDPALATDLRLRAKARALLTFNEERMLGEHALIYATLIRVIGSQKVACVR